MIKKHPAKSRGFTLVEILVALFIFAIIGVLAAMSLQSMIRTSNHLKATDRQLMQMQMALILLRRDISEVIDRPIRNSDGMQEGPFVASGGESITFTRTGLINPFGYAQQSDMQRISYDIEGGSLVRLTWSTLDQPPQAQPEKQILLEGVDSVHWQFVSNKGQTVSEWPPTTGSNMQKENGSVLPNVVLMVMQVKNQGVIQGVFPIPARGNYANAAEQIASP